MRSSPNGIWPALPMPCGERTFEVEFDFLDHVLALRVDDGTTRTMPLAPRSVADFYREYLRLLESLGLSVADLAGAGRGRRGDTLPGRSQARCLRRRGRPALLLRAGAGGPRALEGVPRTFLGKCSPVHFFWGAFDIACTRFSGRRAPQHPGGAPNTPDYVMHEAYSHECISAGWWPGGGPIREAAFYAYAYPEPAGLPKASIRPGAAYYHEQMREFILPYEALRAAAVPDEALLAFLQSTYDAAADLAGWDRKALERGAEGRWAPNRS
jgi:hypothetical protein